MADHRLAAIVLAAGYSSRMKGFKSLYPIKGEPMIERVIRILQEGGIERIFVVTGYQEDLLKPILHDKKVTQIGNPDFDRGMFSSVRAGVKALSTDTQGFLMLPVDYPFVSPETISALIKAFRTREEDIIHPVCQGKRGHPPLIRKSVIQEILSDPGDRGLGVILERPHFSHYSLLTEDEGILYDVDDDGTFKILTEKFTTPPQVGG